MPWINLERLLSILRRSRIDVRMVEVYVEEEAINPRPRNPQVERFEPDGDTEYNDDQYDDEENGY